MSHWSFADKSQIIVKPLDETSSIMRYWTTPGSNLFARAAGDKKSSASLRAEGIWAYRTTCLERRNSRVLVRTESGEEKWVLDAASNDYLRAFGII